MKEFDWAKVSRDKNTLRERGARESFSTKLEDRKSVV